MIDKKINKIIKKEDIDKLLTPIIKIMYPECLLCGKKTQVAHHHFHKSKHSLLRYNLKNLIPLCNGCHFKLSFDESYWGCKIMLLKGTKWFKELEKYESKNKGKTINYELIYQSLK
jgi:5-methylcytosine-specific restriction endonuclease McrA